MSAKSVFCSVLLVVVLGSGAAQGQMAYPAQNLMPGGQATYKPSNPLDDAPVPPVIDEAAPKPPTMQPPARLSQYIQGTQPACCLWPSIGGDGPIQEELFMRTGIALPFGGGTFGNVLSTGFILEGGGRTLFFDVDRTAAWTIEVGVSTTFYHAEGSNHPVPLHILVPTGTTSSTGAEIFANASPLVTIKSLNRTTGNLGFGRECYLWGSAGSGLPNGRVGFDVGGRWGDEKATFSEIAHRTDTVGGLYLALHTDYEIPCGPMITFLVGCRAELDYTWSDILQTQNNSDVMGVNLLLNFGMRF